ncbi:MAG: DUF357 domain-containing protein [Candidatus Aenigmarchaeota archaeon]|nr:DUF357 domain-containing protein [Candidatus Aenigmarchaeota archaeon]
MVNDRIPKAEVVKWLERLDKKLNSVEAKSKGGSDALRNAEAYRDDCRHWLKEGNLFLAFEACVYSWAIVETAENLGEII